ETPQSGWIQMTPNRTVEINASVPILTNQNFINCRQLQALLVLAKSQNWLNGTPIPEDEMINSGVEFQYTIGFGYNASGCAPLPDLDNTTVVDTIPNLLTFVSADHDGVFDPMTRTVTWKLGDLSPNTSGILHLNVKPIVVMVDPVVNNTVTMTGSLQGTLKSITAFQLTTISPGNWPPPMVIPVGTEQYNEGFRYYDPSAPEGGLPAGDSILGGFFLLDPPWEHEASGTQGNGANIVQATPSDEENPVQMIMDAFGFFNFSFFRF
ncbi:MAG: DUF11 domain-containing protein, partial [Methanoregulaceae archaeon]|nr:DUF11 domain-containing protein [Methanoregulaceae archaeon]